MTAPQPGIPVAVARWWWPTASVVVVTAWVVVALLNSARVPPLAAVAAAGTAALAAAPALATMGAPDLAGMTALFILPIAVAEAVRGANAAPLGVVLCSVIVLAAVGRGRNLRPPLALVAVAVGVAAVVTGFVEGSASQTRIHLAAATRPAAALVLAGAAVVVAVVDERVRAERAVAVPVLIAALGATPLLPAVAVAILWGALAAGGAVADRPGIALAGMAVVATAAGAHPAGLLLAAAAVLAWAVDAPIAIVGGLPGGVALAAAITGRSITSVTAVAAAALGLTAVIALTRFRPSVRFDGGRPISLALAGWLVLAPGTWTFAGSTSLHAYDVGAARGVAAAALVAVIVLVRRGGEWEWPEPLRGSDEDPLAVSPALGAALRLAAMAVTVAAAGWLVVSEIRLH